MAKLLHILYALVFLSFVSLSISIRKGGFFNNNKLYKPFIHSSLSFPLYGLATHLTEQKTKRIYYLIIIKKEGKEKRYSRDQNKGLWKLPYSITWVNKSVLHQRFIKSTRDFVCSLVSMCVCIVSYIFLSSQLIIAQTQNLTNKSCHKTNNKMYSIHLLRVNQINLSGFEFYIIFHWFRFIFINLIT